MKALLTVHEVAEKLSISTNMAYILIRRRDIASVRIGRSVRVKPEDLERYISSNTESTSTGDEK